MSNKERKRYHIVITVEVMKKFKHACLDKGINTGQLIELIMLDYLEKNERKKED
jgi:hypothetical protein